MICPLIVCWAVPPKAMRYVRVSAILDADRPPPPVAAVHPRLLLALVDDA